MVFLSINRPGNTSLRKTNPYYHTFLVILKMLDQVFKPKHLYAFYISPMRSACAAKFVLLYLIALKTFGDK